MSLKALVPALSEGVRVEVTFGSKNGHPQGREHTSTGGGGGVPPPPPPPPFFFFFLRGGLSF